MGRKLLYALFALALLPAAAGREARAQDDDGPDVDEHRFEVGAQLTFISINFPRRVVTSPPVTGASTELPREWVSTAGLGARFGYNANEYVALEAEVNRMPERNINEVSQSTRTQGFGGVRVGRRFERAGVFAKARLGAMHFGRYGIRGPCGVIAAPQQCQEQGRVFLAGDLGGVFEFYPTRRTILRLDAGDTVIRFRDSGPITFPPAGTFPGSSIFRRRETTHSFQLGFGFGFRF